MPQKTSTHAPIVKQSVSGMLPRVDVEGASVSQPRPASPSESRGSTPRSTKKAQTHTGLGNVTPMAPMNPDSLNSVQRLGVRTPLSRGSPRAGVSTGEVGEGSEWLQEVGSQMTQFKEINRSITNLWQSARQVDLVQLPLDPRLHSTLGRKQYEEDRKRWIEDNGEHAHNNEHTVGVAIGQFAGLFTAEPEEAPGRDSPADP